MLAGEAMPVNEIERTRGRESACVTRKRRRRRWMANNPVEEEMALERVQSTRAMLEAIDGLLTGH